MTWERIIGGLVILMAGILLRLMNTKINDKVDEGVYNEHTKRLDKTIDEMKAATKDVQSTLSENSKVLGRIEGTLDAWAKKNGFVV